MLLVAKIKQNSEIILKLGSLLIGIVFFCLSTVELSMLISTSIPMPQPLEASTALVTTNGTGPEQVDEVEIPLDGLCSLQDVVCGSEQSPTIARKGALYPPRPDHIPDAGKLVKAPDQFRLTAKKVCGSLGEQCVKDLLAIAYTESKFNTEALGDYIHGKPRSFGPFQIQTKLHKVSITCAKDVYCSAKWTLSRLKAHGYDKGFITASIRAHNGAGPMADRYVAKVKEVSKIIN